MAETLDWWPSPAKLNLFLHITGQDQRGYHLLQSLFQLLDYGDDIAFKARSDDQIRLVTDLPGVPPQDNLIIKAARALQRETQHPFGCDIWLKKRLPMGGGIGGGSSNAATTLLALNHIWKTDINLDELAAIGLRLGADVPIFVRGHTAFAEGVGDIIQPVELACKTYLVAFPDCHVSTADIFAAADLVRDSHPIDWHDYQFSTTRNDCQKVVCQRYPEVANLLAQLLEYAPSRMTGTGACVFAVFDHPEQAKRVQAKLARDCQSFIASGVNTSPLHDMLAHKISDDKS